VLLEKVLQIVLWPAQRGILETSYSQEHVVINAYVTKLMEGPLVRQIDAGALAADMKNCEIACGGVRSAGMDTQHTVSKIFKHLRDIFQDKFMAEVSLWLQYGHYLHRKSA